MFMIQLTAQRNIQFSFHDRMYKIHSLGETSKFSGCSLHIQQLAATNLYGESYTILRSTEEAVRGVYYGLGLQLPTEREACGW